MPTDVGDTIGSALGRIVRKAAESGSTNGHGSFIGKSNGLLSGIAEQPSDDPATLKQIAATALNTAGDLRPVV